MAYININSRHVVTKSRFYTVMFHHCPLIANNRHKAIQNESPEHNAYLVTKYIKPYVQ